MDIDELENFLAERLEMIESGKGHWARCIQAIEKYGDERAAEAYEDAAENYTRPGAKDLNRKLLKKIAAALRSKRPDGGKA